MNQSQKEMMEIADQLLQVVPIAATMEKTPFTEIVTMANNLYTIRQLERAIKAVEGELRKLEAKHAEAISIMLAHIDEPNVSTEYATVTPSSGFILKIPDDEGFRSNLPYSALRAHYPSVVQLVKERVHEGDLVPFGLNILPLIAEQFKVRVLCKH